MNAPALQAPPAPRKHVGKAPVVRCPVCDARANTRSSTEITPTFRELYYRCSNIFCGMTWVASISFERVLSPSGISNDFRPQRDDHGKPPGHDFGQSPMTEAEPIKRAG